MRIAIVVSSLLILAHVARADDAPIRGNEVIVIDGSPPIPKVKAKPKGHYFPTGPMDNVFMRIAPAYSDTAVARDAWTLAWFLLDVDNHGVVTRVKFLNHPGYDLEKIAIRTAFSMKFAPAIGDDGAPARSYVVVPIEWPSHGWLLARTGLASGIPDISHVPCRGSGPLNLGSIYPTYRDCTGPDWSKASSEPWINR